MNPLEKKQSRRSLVQKFGMAAPVKAKGMGTFPVRAFATLGLA